MKKYFYIFLMCLVIPAGSFADDDEDDRDSWLDAAREGNIAKIKLMLQKGFNIETTTDSGNTALKIAAKKNHKELAEFLISQGAEVNSRNRKRHSTPLHAAAKRGRLGIVKLLIKNGAMLDAKTKNRQTPLHLAAKKDRALVVEELLSAGASLEPIDQRGATPLAEAAANGALRTTQILLAKGADPLMVDYEDRNVLQQPGTSSVVRDVLMGTMNVTSIVFNFPDKNEIDNETFSRALSAVLIGRGWSPRKVSEDEFYGDLQKDERKFQVHIRRIGSNLMIAYTNGYGSNKNNYLHNIREDLQGTLKLE